MDEKIEMNQAGEGRALQLGEDMDGARLDKALLALTPEASLSLRRRLIETGQARLDGRPAPPGRKVRAGQVLSLATVAAPTALAPGVRLVLRLGDWAALYKPAGLPTTALAGKPGPSLEACLPGLFPDQSPLLLNRLDTPTSGLVLAALADPAAQSFRNWENEGRVRKHYLALVRGDLWETLVLDRALDTVKRKKTRVLREADPDPTRRTLVEPLPAPPGLPALIQEHGTLTLVRATIKRGARHQIRAHLADLGHALLGDELYGPAGEPPFPLRLHHQHLEMPGFAVEVEPDWPEVFSQTAPECPVRETRPDQNEE